MCVKTDADIFVCHTPEDKDKILQKLQELESSPKDFDDRAIIFPNTFTASTSSNASSTLFISGSILFRHSAFRTAGIPKKASAILPVIAAIWSA